MRKAILCLIFATALLGQPTGVQVDLSVVSVDSGSGEVCFKADARPDGAIFDGTDDHISVPDHADLNFDSTGDFTIEAWFKADAVGRQNPIVCKLVGSNPNFTGYQMWVAPDNKLKAFICDGSYTLVASSSTITADTWYYAAFTVDRDGNEKIYLNGALDCTPVNVSGVGNINTDTTLWLGRATHSPSLAFDGTIAEVRISDKVRSDAEIAAAYADGGEFESDGNTITLWHLNEGSGTTAGDSSGNGHHGTFVGAKRPGSGIEAALVFDGIDDYVGTPDDNNLDFGTDGDFTIEAWFKLDAVGRQNPIVCKLIGSNPDFNGYQLWVAPDNKLKGFICDGSYTRVVSNSSISANNWYYAAFTVDRDGDEKLYLNGALDGTPVDVTSVGNIDTDMPLWLGRGTHDPSLALDGTIAEVRISDVVRSDSEISDAYAMGGSFENDANTIALWHLNEGAGTDISDASGNGHDATAISSEVYEPAVVLDGTDDHISVPDHADLNFDSTGDFTIEAWFKVDAVGRQNPIVCKLIGSNPNFTGYQMWIAPDNKLKAFICDGSYTLVASSSTITANTWYYAAFTVDRDGNEKVYLNGSLDCTPVNVSGVGNINTDTTLWIGRATHSPTLAFDGTIAEVRISDIARTDAEIADAYTDGGSFENDANTIALWHLNEGSGTTAGDSSGNGHDGTLTNGATWGNGVIVEPIPGATWTTGLLPTPPEFTFDYDWENDATYDLTDAGDSVCHTYTPGDSLWAKVKATTATYTAENSAEVIVPEGEEITIEPTLLFSIPIPAGDTVALGEPTEDGRFPVSFTFGGMNDGVIRIYDTTGAVVDSFPNAYGGKSFDISPNGNLVFVSGLDCPESLFVPMEYRSDGHLACSRCCNKQGDVLFERKFMDNGYFSSEGNEIASDATISLWGSTEYGNRTAGVIDTTGNLSTIYRTATDDWNHTYDGTFSKDFQRFWAAEHETLKCISGNDTTIVTTDMWEGIMDTSRHWNPISSYPNPNQGFIDNRSIYWRIGFSVSPDRIVIAAFDTLYNRLTAFSIPGNYSYCRISNDGSYLWAMNIYSLGSECKLFSTDDGSFLEEWQIPISDSIDLIPGQNRGFAVDRIYSSDCFYFGDSKGYLFLELEGTGGEGRVLLSDAEGNELLRLYNLDEYDPRAISLDGRYFVYSTGSTINVYEMWR